MTYLSRLTRLPRWVLALLVISCVIWVQLMCSVQMNDGPTPTHSATHVKTPHTSSSLNNRTAIKPDASYPLLHAPRTVPLPGPIVHYTDADDAFPPREGEKNVSFEMYLDCLAERLNVDRRARVERAFPTLNTTFPYLLVIVTVELGDVRALMCNMDVHVQRLMYVQNGPVSTTTRFFDDVQRAFDFTSRLKIVRYIDNAGFAGAVNTAMRDAMQYTFDEVPFFHLSNNDVRFASGFLAQTLPKFYAVTRGDKVKMEELAAEVATEPNRYTPAKFRSPLLRATSRDTLLQTSRLLPDRIRYMPRTEMMKAFANYTGGLFLGSGAATSSWSMSRLAMETVGLMDENFYPAYYEDTDWRWRQFALGFRDFQAKVATNGNKSYTHFGQTSRKHGEKRNQTDESVAYSLTMGDTIKDTFVSYVGWKWGVTFAGSSNHWKLPYKKTELPLDAWVFNVELHHNVSRRMKKVFEVIHSGRKNNPSNWFRPQQSYARFLQNWCEGNALRRR